MSDLYPITGKSPYTTDADAVTEDFHSLQVETMNKDPVRTRVDVAEPRIAKFLCTLFVLCSKFPRATHGMEFR